MIQTPFFRLISISLGTLAFLSLTACGKSGPVTLVAKNSDTSLASKTLSDSTIQSLTDPTFKVCIKKVTLEDESGEAQGNDSSEGESEEEKNEIEFSVGEVDLTSIATSDVTLGTIADAPVGFKISKVKIKLKKFGSCSHSVQYDTASTDSDVEFRWTFSPAVELNSGDTLDLLLSDIASTIQTAASAHSGNSGLFRAAINLAQGHGKRR